MKNCIVFFVASIENLGNLKSHTSKILGLSFICSKCKNQDENFF